MRLPYTLCRLSPDGCIRLLCLSLFIFYTGTSPTQSQPCSVN